MQDFKLLQATSVSILLESNIFYFNGSYWFKQTNKQTNLWTNVLFPQMIFYFKAPPQPLQIPV